MKNGTAKKSKQWAKQNNHMLPPRKRPDEAIRLQEFREEHELSGPDCCRRMGWPLNRWFRYETGSRLITIDVLDEIAKEFKIGKAMFVMYIYRDRYPFFAKLVKKHWKKVKS